MRAAVWPREDKLSDRLLVVDRQSGAVTDQSMRDLPGALAPGDLLVLNDSATLPASFHGRGPGGEAIELRLAGALELSGPGPAAAEGPLWRGVLFGEGDHRTRTEDRPPPPRVRVGETLRLGEGLSAVVTEVSPVSPRLVTVRFSTLGDALAAAFYRWGKPVQYSYVREPLPLWHVQTAYAARPWSVEEPSAGRSLTLGLLARLREGGVEIGTLTHAAGLSATGDPALDALLPLPERYEILARTVHAVERARSRDRRVVAVGTSVVRALEGCLRQHGRLVAGEGTTDLRIGPSTKLAVVTDLLTGMHEPGTSHFDLLAAFAPPAILDAAHAHAEQRGYLGHELGDFALFVH